MIRNCSILVALVVLAACSAERDVPASEAAVSSEVLEGAITDDMIAYDRLRSQPPLEVVTGEEGGQRGAGAETPAPAGALPDPQTGDAANASDNDIPTSLSPEQGAPSED